MRRLMGCIALMLCSVAAVAQQDYVGRYDVFGGFSYLDSPKLNLQQRGFNTQIGVNLKRWLAFGFDYSIQDGHTSLVAADLKPGLQSLLDAQLTHPVAASLSVPFDARTQTFTLGPQVQYRHFKPITLFVHPSIGVIHEHISLKPNTPLTQAVVAGLVSQGILTSTKPVDTTYFYGFGGGFDVNATKHVHLRFDAEFVHVFLYSDLLKDARNSIRLSVGPTFNFGKNIANSSH